MKICFGFVFLLFCFGLQAQTLEGAGQIVVSNEISINTTGLDFSPAYYRDGIVFVSTRANELRYRVKDERIKTNIMKLWSASRSLNGVLFDAKPFSDELSSLSHEGPMAFTAEYDKIYFTRNELSKGGRKSKKLKKLKIYTADLVGDTWENIRIASFNDELSNTAHPAITADGRRLIFASDREGGYGGMDLWAVDLIGDEWSEPFNLGPTINTPENEIFPTLKSDGTLYFSTTVYNGKEANLDIYYVKSENGEWNEKVALKEPFNSPFDDYGIIFDKEGTKGYFSSNREGGLGGDDIYGFSLTGKDFKKKINLTVQITDATSGEPIAAATIKYLNTSEVSLGDAVAGGMIAGSTETGLTLTGGVSALSDSKGVKSISVEPGTYMVSVEAKGYLPAQQALILKEDDLNFPIALDPVEGCANLRIVVLDENSLSPVAGVKVDFDSQGEVPDFSLTSNILGVVSFCMPCDEVYGISATISGQRSNPASFDTRGSLCGRVNETTMTLYLHGISTVGPDETPLVAGTVIQLPSVYYTFDQWQLSSNARNDLNHLASLLERYPSMDIILGSHTDSKGDKTYNQQLSQQRANEAKRYLVEEGRIDPKRVTAIGYGESKPVNRCSDGITCTEADHRQNRRTEITVSYLDNPVAISSELANAVERSSLEVNASTDPSSTSTNPVSESYTENDKLPPVTKATTSTRRFAPSELIGGKYWVVAGTFQDYVNAEQRQQELEELGYIDIQIVDFEKDGFNAVVVGKFTKLAEAAQFSRAIKEAHRMGAYVRKVE